MLLDQYNQTIVMDTSAHATGSLQQLVDAYAADIREGRLAPGTRLPTHRQLAASQGWPCHGLACVRGTGIHGPVRRDRPRYLRARTGMAGLPGHGHADAAASMADLSFNYPSLPGRRATARALRQLAQSGDLDALLRYQPHGGRP